MQNSKKPIEHLFVLRVLILQQKDGLWAAQGIDYDIVAQGNSIREAKKAFERTIVGQILFDFKNGRKPLAEFPPAPREIQEIFEKAGDITLDDKGPIELPVGTPEAFICNQITKEFRLWD
jgi:hypothetical protein